MDEHARRMIERFLDAVQDFQDGGITLLGLSDHAGQTAAPLDNSSAPLPKLLLQAQNDLESAYFTTEEREHNDEAARILAPILTVLEQADRASPGMMTRMSESDNADIERAPICASCGVTALTTETSNVIDSGFVCENPDCDGFGDVVES